MQDLAAQRLALEFETHRRRLRGLAYRMLGSRADAEDAVQDAWLRWAEVDRANVDNAQAYLTRVVTRLCLDRLKSAQARREHYVGPWLPEPLVDQLDRFDADPGPAAAHELASDLSFAFLLALERLSPLERAAFLLHDVFDLGFDEVAAALGRSGAACRQLASRARAKVREDRPRFAVPAEDAARLAGAFFQALQDGDMEALTRVLAEEVTFVSDGGGRVTAVSRPVQGREPVAQLLIGYARQYDLTALRARPAEVNGLPGAVMFTLDGVPIQTIAVEADDQGCVRAVYVVRNPDKLAGLAS